MKAIPAAIAEAKQELKYVISEITAFTTRRSQLETFIESGQLLGKSLRPETQLPKATKAQSQPPKPAQPVAWPNALRRENWRNTVEVLKKAGRPLTANEIVKALAERGTPIGGEHQRESVRSMIARKSDVFEKVGPGFWALKEWALKEWGADLKQEKHAKLQ